MYTKDPTIQSFRHPIYGICLPTGVLNTTTNWAEFRCKAGLFFFSLNIFGGRG